MSDSVLDSFSDEREIDSRFSYNFTINENYGNGQVVLLFEFGVSVDIDRLNRYAIPERRISDGARDGEFRLIAETAVGFRENLNLHFPRGCEQPSYLPDHR